MAATLSLVDPTPADEAFREPVGGAFQQRGQFFIRVTIGPRKRVAARVPWANSIPEAEARGKLVQSWVNRLRAAGLADLAPKFVKSGATANEATVTKIAARVESLARADGAYCIANDEKPKADGPVTFRKFAGQWTSGELHKLYPDHVPEISTADDNEMRLRKWVYPVVQDVSLSSFTLDLALEVLRRIPREKSRATRRHVAQLMSRVLNLAVYPCRLLPASPLPRNFLPKLGPSKALAYLYPDEDAKLMACTDCDEQGAPKVPLVHRLIYGFMAREGVREGEARGLQWRDLDLARGVVRLDDNKTDDPRGWTLDSGVVRALEAWRTMVPSQDEDLVFDRLTKPYALAEMFRDHLRASGVDRPELFESSKARRQVRVHDLRATFVTLSLANGRTETWVADRTGHKSSLMINRYRRAARTVEELGLGWLAPLDEAIPEICCRVLPRDGGSTRGSTGEMTRTTLPVTTRFQTKFRRRDSNPNKRNQNPLSCHWTTPEFRLPGAIEGQS